MSAKDLIIDFINFAFIVLLISFCLIYFIAGNHFFVFTSFLEAMVPLAFFGIIFLIRLKMIRGEIRWRKKHDSTELVLQLNIFHRLVSDIIIFGTPILLGLLIYKARGVIDVIDVVMMIFVFLSMFFWQGYIFSKER